ncbi:protein of unknown function [Methylocaldum szegediense]|uniref:YlxR domain-containing protein n=1 Tax=Methylocaldum szegediense TaxID=73780 RepID=A0ABN8X5Q7_9GAMM|nr:protein of unknown function [Methylocaldum szegediense]
MGREVRLICPPWLSDPNIPGRGYFLHPAGMKRTGQRAAEPAGTGI